MAKKATIKPKLETLSTIYGDFETVLTEKYKKRTKWEPKNEKKILSFIPGTMMSIDVKAGDKVKVGDTLVTFNAMKMLNTYKSPVAGVVKKVYVNPGDIVPKGALLLEFK